MMVIMNDGVDDGRWNKKKKKNWWKPMSKSDAKGLINNGVDDGRKEEREKKKIWNEQWWGWWTMMVMMNDGVDAMP